MRVVVRTGIMLKRENRLFVLELLNRGADGATSIAIVVAGAGR